MPIFRVKSVKIYTGQKKFTREFSWLSWQIWGMPPNEIIQYVFTSNQLGLWNFQQQKCCDASTILISAESLNDLVYIHLCDLTWATPRIFCWQDDRRSRSDQVAKDKLIQFNVYFSVNFADESSQLSIISFMDCLSQSSRISILTKISHFSVADEFYQPKMNYQQTGINYLSQIPGTAW